MAKKLQLTDAQKKNAADIAQRLKAELSEYSAEAEGAKKQKEKLFTFRKDRLSEMEKALTADQKTAWVTMLGDAPTGFDVDEMWLTIEKNWLFRWEE